MNGEETFRALTNTLAEQDDVLAAYLFGSHTAGTARPDSDIDIALLLGESNGALPFFRQLPLIDILSEACGREVDVIVLEDAPPILQCQVLRHGRLILERDRRAHVQFEVLAGQIYADL